MNSKIGVHNYVWLLESLKFVHNMSEVILLGSNINDKSNAFISRI